MAAPGYVPTQDDLEEPGGAAPAVAPAPIDLVPAGTQAAGSIPETATVEPAAPAEPPPLGPPPKPPALTGDPSADHAANVQWQRNLTDWHAQAMGRKAEVDAKHADILAEGARREAEAAKADQQKRAALAVEREADRKRRQADIDAAVQERIAAHKDLETKDPITGGQIIAAIFSGIGAALQNYGAAQQGHVGNAQNEALNTINAIQKQRYEKRKERLAAASDSLLQARYGFKDAADNHRAAMNDLDADTAAQYKLIAKETESALRARGATDAQVAGNQMLADFLSKAAAAEGQIHDREEQREDQRKHYAAEEAMAKAHLGMQREQINATREARADARDDRREAAAARAAAAEEKKAEAKDKRTVRDPETQEPLGLAPSERVVDKIADKITSTQMYLEAVDKLADHIEKHGHLLNPYSDLAKERESLTANTQALGRSAKGIQASDAGQKLEHQMIGGSGIGLNRTASPKVLRSLANEARDQTRRKLMTELAPLDGEAKARMPSEPAKAPETKEVNGHTYEKTDGGWKLVK